MILGYMRVFPWGKPTDFKKKINQGIKIHTMRYDVNDRWRFGILIQHAHGQRTKQYECFANGMCTATQRVTILINNLGRSILIGDRALNYQQQKKFALNDGFDNLEDFWRYFDKSGTLKLVHWTDAYKTLFYV